MDGDLGVRRTNSRASGRSRRAPARDSWRIGPCAAFFRGRGAGADCHRFRRLRDSGVGAARRIGLLGDRAARRRTAGQAARSRAGGRRAGERDRRRNWLSDHSRATGVELFVAMAAGAFGGRSVAGSSDSHHAAGAIEVVECRRCRYREAQSLLRYFSSDLSTPIDHVADLRSARHRRRHRSERLALLSGRLDPGPLARIGKHAGGYREWESA